MAYSNTAKDLAVNAVKGGGTWISAHSADPGKTGANLSSISRAQTTWGANADNGTTRESVGSQVSVPMTTGGTAAWFGVWSASTAGNFLYGGQLAASETFNNPGGVALITPRVTFPD